MIADTIDIEHLELFNVSTVALNFGQFMYLWIVGAMSFWIFWITKFISFSFIFSMWLNINIISRLMKLNWIKFYIFFTWVWSSRFFFYLVQWKFQRSNCKFHGIAVKIFPSVHLILMLENGSYCIKKSEFTSFFDGTNGHKSRETYAV